MPASDHSLATGRRGFVATAAVLFLILAAAWGIRYAFLVHAEAAPGFTWADPDGYTRQARALVGEDGRWRWSWGAVYYVWNDRTWALPPGYPVFLSWFALDRAAFPRNAAHAHPVLGMILCAALFWLAARLHSRRAGLVAAAIGAVWLPNAAGASAFFQEQLYVPLLAVAFAVTVDVWSREARSPMFALGGAAFAVAALTRAMPLYFVPIVALMLIFATTPRPIGLRRAGWFVVGFALLVVPYVAWLSAAHGQLIPIDNHGSIEMTNGPAMISKETPGIVDSVRLLVAQIAAGPLGFARGKYDMLRGLFHVQGGRWLQFYGGSSSLFAAAVWKVIAHVFIDLAFVLTVLLAPFGVALARRSREAVLVALWIPTLAVLSVAASYAGARYRAPFEPHIIVLASVVMAGEWRRVTWRSMVPALACALLVAFMVVPQIERSIRAWPDYGVGKRDPGQTVSTFTARGPVGFNVLTLPGANSMTLVLADAANTRALDASVKVDGRPIGDITIGSTPFSVTLAGEGARMVYVEIEPRPPLGGPTPPYIITSPR